tara:strand:- start:4492 stop:5265 length:774 start_codon:yes stop_codon:yes gene_type:complete
MKFIKTLSILLLISACQTSVTEESYVGAVTEPYRMTTDLNESSSLSSGDYIIKSAYGSMDVSTSNFDNKVNEFKNLVTQYNGNVSDSYLSTNYQGLKSFSITANIPAENFDEFLIEVENIEDFSDISINANDVTTYVLDIDSRLSSLMNEKKALEEIKDEAKTTSDRLEVQNQLRYVNQDIEMLNGQKEYYANATSYSKLSLNIREGSGISLFSWNYYFERSLSWIESIVGVAFSVGIIALPIYLLFLVIKKIRKKE